MGNTASNATQYGNVAAGVPGTANALYGSGQGAFGAGQGLFGDLGGQTASGPNSKGSPVSGGPATSPSTGPVNTKGSPVSGAPVTAPVGGSFKPKPAQKNPYGGPLPWAPERGGAKWNEGPSAGGGSAKGGPVSGGPVTSPITQPMSGPKGSPVSGGPVTAPGFGFGSKGVPQPPPKAINPTRL